MKKLTKKLVAVTLTITALIGAVGAVYASSPIGISINGRTIASDVSPVMEDGRTLVPIRVISENLGAEVKYDAKAKKVTITKDSTNLVLTLNQKQIIVNGNTQTIDVPAKAVKGRTLVPIRVVSENLNCTTVWDANKKMVIITTDGADTGIGTDTPSTDVDSWGRGIRTSNLPKGAEYFPYICDDVPNWAYEEIIAYMKNTNGRAIWSGFGKDEFGVTYPAWDSSDKNTPKDFWNSRYSVEAYYDRLEKYLNFCLNIDYRTLTREQVASIMTECMNERAYKDVNREIDAWYNYYKSNKIVVSGKAIIMPEGFHMTEEGRPVITAFITFKVESQGEKKGGYGNIGVVREDSGFINPDFITGKTYQGLYVCPTTWYIGDANNYQLDYNYSLIDIRNLKVID
jgi:hypothetical protein